MHLSSLSLNWLSNLKVLHVCELQSRLSNKWTAVPLLLKTCLFLIFISNAPLVWWRMQTQQVWIMIFYLLSKSTRNEEISHTCSQWKYITTSWTDSPMVLKKQRATKVRQIMLQEDALASAKLTQNNLLQHHRFSFWYW